jgi:glutathione S-transferase
MGTAAVTTEVTTPTLYVCHLETTMPRFHPCAKADAALAEAGVEHDRVVYGKGKPFGIGTKGTREDLAAVSGQEKLPVLVLPGGEVVAGSKAIVSWAKTRGG